MSLFFSKQQQNKDKRRKKELVVPEKKEEMERECRIPCVFTLSGALFCVEMHDSSAELQYEYV